MKRILFLILIFAAFTVDAQNGLTKVYRVGLIEKIKDIDRDTIYVKVQLIQQDIRQNAAWVRLYEFNTRRAVIQDNSKFLKVIGNPIDFNMSYLQFDMTILSDSIKSNIARYYNVPKARVVKLTNL